MARLAIIGTGMVGASLGLAIKQAKVKDLEIVGTDLERRHANQAKNMGAVDRTSGSMVGAVDGAQVVVIATPVMAIKEVMEIIGPSLEPGCLVTDTGSSKGVVLEWADEILPSRVNFVGGDPIISNGGSGPEGATADAFNNRPYCIIPSRKASQSHVQTLTDLIRTIGGKPYYIDIAEHDSFVGAVDQLPTLLGVALVSCTSQSPSWDDIAQVASHQYREMTKPAALDPQSTSDSVLSNQEGVVSWIDSFIGHLYEVRKILTEHEDKDAALRELFYQAAHQRARWMAGAVSPEMRFNSNRERPPTAMEAMGRMFTGDPSAQKKIFGRSITGDRTSDGDKRRR